MSQFLQQEPEEEEYFEPEEYNSKRKRLTMREDYPIHVTHEPRHPAVEIVAWLFVGSIGIALTAGSAIVAAREPVGDEWVMIVPLIYMMAAMFWMRRR